MRRWLPLAALALALPAAASAQDFTATVTRTADGAYVQGSPKARVKLVEYISYTCPHCGHYIVESADPMKPRVARGEVSIELRHATRDPVDLTAALLARCGGPRRVFGNTQAIMAAQSEWLPRIGQWLDANSAAWQAQPTGQRLMTIAAQSGLADLMKRRGYTQKQLDACLASAPEQALLATMAKGAWSRIKATPSFAVNGTLADGAHQWSDVAPLLDAAAARR